MEFSRMVRQHRDRLGLTQDELGEKVGQTGSSVSKWESGDSKPRTSTLRKLAEIFGVSVSDLIEDDGAVPGAMRAAGSSRMVPVRRLGMTHAGEPMEELPDEGIVEVPETVALHHPRGYMLEVVGDCMDRSYPPGCLVMVDPDMSPWNGCDVVAETEPGESVLRRYQRGSSTLMLSPDSFEQHEDMVFTGDSFAEVRLVGVVCWFQASEDVRGR